MKKIIFTALAVSCISLSFTANAQQDLKDERKDIIEKPGKPGKKEHQEIIIKSNGDKEIKLNVEIDGDKVLVNGKPLVEFKEDGITINKRKMIYHDGDNMTFDLRGMDDLQDMEGLDKLNEMNIDLLNSQRPMKVSHSPFLGVTTEKTTDGAKIVEIAKGSAAEKAGLKTDDVITKIGDQRVTDGQVLADIIADKKPKEDIKISYKRAGKNKEAKAILGERTESLSYNYSFNNPNAMVRSFKSPRIDVRPMPGGDALKENFNMDGNFDFGSNEEVLPGFNFPRQKRLGLKIQDTEEGGNVKVINVDTASAAEKAGLKKDDIIMEINGEKINNTDDAREQLLEVAEKSAYTIKAKRNGTEMSFEVKNPKKLKTANL